MDHFCRMIGILYIGSVSRVSISVVLHEPDLESSQHFAQEFIYTGNGEIPGVPNS